MHTSSRFRLFTCPPLPRLLCNHYHPTGSNYYVRILSTLNRELLKPSSSVALHRHSNALVDILPPEADSSISLLGDNEKPNVTYQVGVLVGPFSLSPALRVGAEPDNKCNVPASEPPEPE